MLKLYENIKNYREKLGLSQQELAELTEYSSRSSIAKIEAGEVDIPESKIGLFAKAFKITPQQLMGWEENEENKTNEDKNWRGVFGDRFANREDAIDFIKNQGLVATNEGYNLREMTDDEILEFANGIVYLKDLAEKKREKDRLRRAKKG